ncbi:hypothetical protein TELCIR_16364 [Teladorsagia circumcincta]|uniref:Uncharacterized protein n=1 Tax=Teladorsagia circumcincta TaxID=45464 RepID=A0A2G9TVP8_TELCI|nr:hypothetical protein TELCIR_16364 [Teladorsagia circumcincta]
MTRNPRHLDVIIMKDNGSAKWTAGEEGRMPRIEFEPKLDFKDVLLRPKRSTLKSRADVDLVRE